MGRMDVKGRLEDEAVQKRSGTRRRRTKDREREERSKEAPEQYSRKDGESGAEGGGDYIDSEEEECYDGPQRGERPGTSSRARWINAGEVKISRKKTTSKETRPNAGGFTSQGEGQVEKTSEQVVCTWGTPGRPGKGGKRVEIIIW